MMISDRIKHDEFLRKLKDEWGLMWRERFDDKVRAESVATRDYPLLLMDRGFIIFATRDFRPLRFSEILDYWASQNMVYAPSPEVGGWGKFIRTIITRSGRRRMNDYAVSPRRNNEGRQLKKGGRGWLHASLK
ncbi:hypothetical protein KEJ34_07945 [Candidatus Bathyarchaeota archaeon]|nr:hypothetical protein [Candidatus Bathyarchaeota archaeon]